MFKHFHQKFFFSRAFEAHLKSKIKFQGFSRTSRSSMNPEVTLSKLSVYKYIKMPPHSLKIFHCIFVNVTVSVIVPSLINIKVLIRTFG